MHEIAGSQRDAASTITGATIAKVDADNTGITNINRIGRGFRNPENYRMRTLLTSATRTVA